MKSQSLPLAGLLGLALVGIGCPSQDALRPSEDAGRSPNATLLPSPRSSIPTLVPRDAGYDGPVGMPADSRGRLVFRDAQAPEPTPLAPAKALEPERLVHREMQGLTLTAEWSWDGVPSAPPGPEVHAAGVKAARAVTRHLWQIELLEAGRLRVVFDAPSFALTKYTELRSRSDLFGHILVWPNSESYRIIPSGALRALLDERRVDVSPLTTGQAEKEQAGRPSFGFPTRTVVVATPWGKVDLVQARTVNAGSGGPLLCRLLLELVGARPDSPACEDGKVPVRASYTWKDGGKVEFEVSSLLIRSDFQSSMFVIPPARSTFTDVGLPPNATGIFLTREQMAAFRSRVADLPDPRTDPESNGAPGEGFVAVNRTDALRFLVLDGVPVAWVPAHGEQYVIGSRAGKYTAQWRSFLGMSVDDPFEVLVPARFALGEQPDAGAAGAAGARP